MRTEWRCRLHGVAKALHMEGSQAPPFACGAHKAGLRLEARLTRMRGGSGKAQGRKASTANQPGRRYGLRVAAIMRAS
jgi:hypothetical protein